VKPSRRLPRADPTLPCRPGRSLVGFRRETGLPVAISHLGLVSPTSRGVGTHGVGCAAGDAEHRLTSAGVPRARFGAGGLCGAQRSGLVGLGACRWKLWGVHLLLLSCQKGSPHGGARGVRPAETLACVLRQVPAAGGRLRCAERASAPSDVPRGLCPRFAPHRGAFYKPREAMAKKIIDLDLAKTSNSCQAFPGGQTSSWPLCWEQGKGSGAGLVAEESGPVPEEEDGRSSARRVSPCVRLSARVVQESRCGRGWAVVWSTNSVVSQL